MHRRRFLAALPAMSPHFKRVHAHNSNLFKGVDNIVHFIFANDRLDFFHRLLPQPV